MNLFIHRFNSLLERKKMLKEWSVYSGAQREYGLLKPVVKPKPGSFMLPVVRTVDTYMSKSKIIHPWEMVQSGAGISMTISGGSFLHIPFGTRVYTSSEKLLWKNSNWISLRPFTSIITGGNIEIGEYSIRDNELFEKDYWIVE